MPARILFYDIECKPLTVHAWGLRDQFIAINQIKEDPAVIGVGAMWLGDKRAKFYGLDTLSREEMLTRAHELLDQADLAIGYNKHPGIRGAVAARRVRQGGDGSAVPVQAR